MSVNYSDIASGRFYIAYTKKGIQHTGIDELYLTIWVFKERRAMYRIF